MVTIKLTLFDIFTGIQDWINKAMKSDIEIFDTNYIEFHMQPKNIDLYIKEKTGKKTSYKKIKHFFTTDPYNTGLSVTLEDNKTIKEKLVLDCDLSIEEDLHNYRVYNSEDTPLNGSKEYIDCKTRDKAIQLSKLLNRIDNSNNWVWA